jgi:hypothetical protein
MVTCIIGAFRQERNLLWIESLASGGFPILVQHASRVPTNRQTEADEDFLTEIFSPDISSSNLIEHLRKPSSIQTQRAKDVLGTYSTSPCGVTTQPGSSTPLLASTRGRRRGGELHYQSRSR